MEGDRVRILKAEHVVPDAPDDSMDSEEPAVVHMGGGGTEMDVEVDLLDDVVSRLETFHHFLAPRASLGAFVLATKSMVSRGEFTLVSIRVVSSEAGQMAPPSVLALEGEREREDARRLVASLTSEEVFRAVDGLWVSVDAYVAQPRHGGTMRTSGPVDFGAVVSQLTERVKSSEEGKEDEGEELIRPNGFLELVFGVLQKSVELLDAKNPGELASGLFQLPPGRAPVAAVDIDVCRDFGWSCGGVLRAYERRTAQSTPRLLVVRDARPANRTATSVFDEGDSTEKNEDHRVLRAEKFADRIQACARTTVGKIVGPKGDAIRPQIPVMPPPSTTAPRRSASVPRRRSKIPTRRRVPDPAQDRPEWSMHEVSGPDGARYRFLLVGAPGDVTPSEIPPIEIHDACEDAVAAVSGRRVPKRPKPTKKSSSPVHASPAGVVGAGRGDEDAVWRAHLQTDIVDMASRTVVSRAPVFLSKVLVTRDRKLRNAVLQWIEAHPGLWLAPADARALRIALQRSTEADDNDESNDEQEERIEPTHQTPHFERNPQPQSPAPAAPQEDQEVQALREELRQLKERLEAEKKSKIADNAQRAESERNIYRSVVIAAKPYLKARAALNRWDLLGWRLEQVCLGLPSSAAEDNDADGDENPFEGALSSFRIEAVYLTNKKSMLSRVEPERVETPWDSVKVEDALVGLERVDPSPSSFSVKNGQATVMETDSAEYDEIMAQLYGGMEGVTREELVSFFGLDDIREPEEEQPSFSVPAGLDILDSPEEKHDAKPLKVEEEEAKVVPETAFGEDGLHIDTTGFVRGSDDVATSPEGLMELHTSHPRRVATSPGVSGSLIRNLLFEGIAAAAAAMHRAARERYGSVVPGGPGVDRKPVIQPDFAVVRYDVYTFQESDEKDDGASETSEHAVTVQISQGLGGTDMELAAHISADALAFGHDPLSKSAWRAFTTLHTSAMQQWANGVLGQLTSVSTTTSKHPIVGASWDEEYNASTPVHHPESTTEQLAQFQDEEEWSTFAKKVCPTHTSEDNPTQYLVRLQLRPHRSPDVEAGVSTSAHLKDKLTSVIQGEHAIRITLEPTGTGQEHRRYRYASFRQIAASPSHFLRDSAQVIPAVLVLTMRRQQSEQDPNNTDAASAVLTTFSVFRKE